MPTPPLSSQHRLEIQGLRAIAVLVVLLFHIWPNTLRGGYVGVDVFFVISGYLITGLLLREAERSGNISLPDFYQRRIRRLLPAASLVILVSCLLVGLLPRVQWADTAKEALASTLYVQNWWLASQAVDYLAEDSAPGLLRHYWSLSVEEQYYIFWPLVFLLATRCSTTARRHPRKTFAVIVGTLGCLSFLYSVYLTRHNPPLAYFATTTRAWELALGGGLAIFTPALPSLPRALTGWLGILLIGAACVAFNQTTPFPGYMALLPTIGTALVITAGHTPQRWSAYQLLRLRPMQYFGDLSYSLYLWHWPVLILYTAAVPSHRITLRHGLLILAISIVLAHLSKKLVEDPFRGIGLSRHAWIRSPRLIMAMSLAFMGVSVGTITLRANERPDEQTASAAMPVSPELLQHAYDPGQPTVPTLLNARRDNPDVYALKCHANQISSEPSRCVFGPATARHKIVLVGDSHAAQWLPALQEQYKDRPDWQIITYTKSACAFIDVTVLIGKDRRPYESCSDWNRRMLDELKQLRPDIVVTSQSAGHRALGATDGDTNLRILADGMLKRWNQLRELGARVVVIRDTPWMSQNIPECLSAPGATITGCSTPAGKALLPDPILLAMQSKPPVTYLDMTDQICDATTCWPIKGQILLYRDRHHLTATFVRLLAPKFAQLEHAPN